MTPQHATQKQRERDDIARHVDQYLRRGGEIRVIESPRGICQPIRNITWIGREDLDVLVDRGV